MEKKEKNITLQNSSLSYLKVGEEGSVHICFHGFGQQKEVFDTWINGLDNMQLYSFDLFFHGKSTWKEVGERLDKSFLKQLFEEFFQNENIHQCSITSFSIGARYAWTLLELFPQKIKNIHLISPDGIKENIWFRLATKSYLGRWVFKFLSKNQSFLPKLTKFAYQLRIIAQNQFRLAQSQIQHIEKRKQVYHTWTLLAKHKYHQNTIYHILATYSIQFFIYYSENDKIIPPKNLNKFMNNIPCQQFKLKSQHHKILKDVKNLWRNVEKNDKIV